MEQTNVLRLLSVRVYFWQENSIVVSCTIEVFAVASKTTKVNTLIFFVPVVDSQKDITLVDSPSVWQCGNERTVNHIPKLAVVLLFLVHNAIKNSTALAHCKRTKLCENIRFWHTILLTNVFNLSHNFLCHILIVVVVV